MAIQNHRDLLVWQKSMDFVTDVYRETRIFPKEELYSLTSQIRRAAVSIPSNIAEGQGRGTGNEWIHFLYVAHGSLREVETQILIAQRLNYWNEATARDLMTTSAEVGRLLNGLIRSLKSRATR